jgi:hypothetical protein
MVDLVVCGDECIDLAPVPFNLGVNTTGRHHRALTTVSYGASNVRDDQAFNRCLASMKRQWQQEEYTQVLPRVPSSRS